MRRRGKRGRWGEVLLNPEPYLEEVCVFIISVTAILAACNGNREGQCKALQTQHRKETEAELLKPRLTWNLSYKKFPVVLETVPCIRCF